MAGPASTGSSASEGRRLVMTGVKASWLLIRIIVAMGAGGHKPVIGFVPTTRIRCMRCCASFWQPSERECWPVKRPSAL
jgi:hypothetical protein